jgi:glycosyltransferase involved in cell wall biosynthesis
VKYRLIELELSQPIQAVQLEPDEHGFGLTARWHDRLIGFRMFSATRGIRLSEAALARIADEHFAPAVLTAKVAAELQGRSEPVANMPRLTVAICTKDRPKRLARLLASIAAIRDRSHFAGVDVLVVDNASTDEDTRQVTFSWPDVRYVREPKPGLNFARNAALDNATGDLLAFLDDDVVVDRDWLNGLAAAWREAPHAGGFTGLVLPLRLETEAQIYFERQGGFGRGFERREFRATSFAYPLHPVGAGLVGAGCNMAFDVTLLRQLGGFDEALDTGAPLPGGGDLDIFYRVLRARRAIVYEPRYAVRHEHRETVAQLRRQYWSWGLGMMAFLVKSWRADPAYRQRQTALVRWWFLDQFKSLGMAVARRRSRDAWFRFAELVGGTQGLVGEYDRSQRRVAKIRAQRP